MFFVVLPISDQQLHYKDLNVLDCIFCVFLENLLYN